jgi:hypothetical protein
VKDYCRGIVLQSQTLHAYSARHLHHVYIIQLQNICFWMGTTQNWLHGLLICQESITKSKSMDQEQEPMYLPLILLGLTESCGTGVE